MTTFQQYQEEFVVDLLSAFTAEGRPAAERDTPAAGVRALMDALPYYGDQDFRAAHRGTLVTLLRVNMANNAISAQPSESSFFYYTYYTYQGPYSGYGDAFCHGATGTAASAAVAAAARAASPAITPGWWQDYAIATLTCAAQQAAGLSLNLGKLNGDLTGLNNAFAPALTASVLATLQTAYQPTASALSALTAAGQLPAACAELVAALATSAFTANINAAISKGGDSTQAATWFLYTLWITLKAVGCTDVDAQIQARQAAGLTVPPQIGPQRWWQGGYATWHTPLGGADIAPTTGGMLTAGMPEKKVTNYVDGGPQIENVAPGNGYSQSLCYWGPLARYKN